MNIGNQHGNKIWNFKVSQKYSKVRMDENGMNALLMNLTGANESNVRHSPKIFLLAIHNHRVRGCL